MFRVYIVDDDELILQEIVHAVPWLDNGYEVCGCATNPHTALHEIQSLSPDVVITDLKMPAMTGIELIQTLKDEGVDCEFVMLSAFGTFVDSRSFFLLGGFDYILKPLQQDYIQNVLERLNIVLLKKNKSKNKISEAVNPAFLNLIAYITENFNTKITLEKLAKLFDLNANYICNLFAKHYNSTLTRYITDLRMAEALLIMSKTKKPLKEVAIECGYTDYYYFCKVFKEYYKSSPTEYRKNYL